jgi:SAM-dependent methyltransferase
MVSSTLSNDIASAAPSHGTHSGGVSCAACGFSICNKAFAVGGHAIYDCARCSHRFSPVSAGAEHVSHVYGDGYFTEGAAGYSDYLGDESLRRASGAWYARLLARYTSPGHLLDVGSAAGFILKGLTDGGWTGMGLEPNASMAAHARERVGVDVRVGTLEGCELDRAFDAVTMIQVVGHFYDLRGALAAAASATKPGGYWLIESWDRQSLPARLLGARWHEYSPPSVIQWFTPTSLASLVAEFGFREVARGRPRKQIRPSHAFDLIRHKLGMRASTRSSGAAGQEWVLPYPPLDLFWGLYRKRADP